MSSQSQSSLPLLHSVSAVIPSNISFNFYASRPSQITSQDLSSEKGPAVFSPSASELTPACF